MDARLLLVLHPDARIGEDVGPAVLLVQAEEEQRIGEGEAHQIRFAGVPFTQRDGARGAGGAGEADGERTRVAEAELEQAVPRHLEDLDFEHHLGLGQVLSGNEALGEADRGRRVLDHQQVDLLVDENVARLDQGADHVRGLLDVGVGEVEALHHQLLVLAQLLRRVGEDEHGVLVEDLLLQLVGEQGHADRVLDGRVAQRDAGALVGAHVAVEDEVDAGGALQHLEHVAHRHLAQLDRDRLQDRGPQLHGDDHRLHQLVVDGALQATGVALLRVLGEHRTQHVLRLAVFPRLYQLLGRGHQGAVAPVGLDLRQPGGGAGIAGIVRLHAAVERFGALVLPGLPQHLGLRQPLRDHQLAQPEILAAHREVVGVLLRRLLQQRERLVAVAVVEARARLVDHGGARATHYEKESQRREAPHRSCHSVSPEGRACSVTRTWASSCVSAAFLRSKRSASIEAVGMLVSSTPRKPRSCA